jgi:hypothetical protein
VRERRFPQERRTYPMADDELAQFEWLVEQGAPIVADDVTP